MKQFFFLTGVLLCLCGAANAKPYTAADSTGPVLTFVNNDTLYNFDAVPLQEQVSNQFQIKNTGDAPLVITGVTCKSGNVACRCDHRKIKPGKTGVITIIYTANGNTGSFLHDIVIASNYAALANPAMRIKGAIVPVNTPVAPKAGKSSHGRGGRSKLQ